MLRYLVGGASIPAQVSRGFDIGGPEILTYRGMMLRYAEIAGLPVGGSSASRCSRLAVQPLGRVWSPRCRRRSRRPLVDSLRHEVVCKEHDIAKYVPDPQAGLIGFTGPSSSRSSGCASTT